MLNTPILRTRQHPMALVHPGWIIAALVSLAIAYAVNNPVAIIRVFHLHQGDWLANIYRTLYFRKNFSIAVPAIIAFVLFLSTWSSWAFTYLEVDKSVFTYRLGPFSTNAIPRRAVQDVIVSRGIGGMTFGYGTLRIYSGRTIETIPFVPNVEQIARMIEGPAR